MSAISSGDAFARREVRSLPHYNAGLSADAVRKAYAPLRIAKLASNENPLGPSPLVREAMRSALDTCALYPDPRCDELRAAMAEKLSLDKRCLVFGNGSEDLLSVICRTFLDHGDQVVTVTPAFGLHTVYAQAAGAEVIGVPMTASLQLDVSALVAAVTPRTRMLLFSCPSNPVGCGLTAAELVKLLAGLPPHVLLVLDEAYYEYAADSGYPETLSVLRASERPFVVLRTFSKAYGLAGLRIGYGVAADPSLVDLMDRMRTPFNVNQVAQAAALAAWRDEAHLAASVRHVTEERRRVGAVLCRLGLQPAPSMTNFLFFAVPLAAETLNQALLRQGVIVKPWREPGFESYLRVSIGSREDNDWFLHTLEETLEAPGR